MCTVSKRWLGFAFALFCGYPKYTRPQIPVLNYCNNVVNKIATQAYCSELVLYREIHFYYTEVPPHVCKCKQPYWLLRCKVSRTTGCEQGAAFTDARWRRNSSQVHLDVLCCRTARDYSWRSPRGTPTAGGRGRGGGQSPHNICVWQTARIVHGYLLFTFDITRPFRFQHTWWLSKSVRRVQCYNDCHPPWVIQLGSQFTYSHCWVSLKTFPLSCRERLTS